MGRWGKEGEVGGQDYSEEENEGLLCYGERGMPWRYIDTKEERQQSVSEGVMEKGAGWGEG